MHQDFWELMSSGGPFVTSQGTASSTIYVALKLVTHFFFFFSFHLIALGRAIGGALMDFKTI